MIRIINEKFSESMPDWLKKAFKRNQKYLYGDVRNSELGLALDKAEYIPAPIPSSARAKEFKDPNRLQIFRIGDNIHIPKVIHSYVRVPGKGYVDTNTLNYKTLVSITDEYGYLDLGKYNTKDLRKSRSIAKAGADNNRKKNMGQSWSEYNNSWITSRGYDKSGYPLKPDKYIKMLSDLDASDTSRAEQRIEKLYNRIENVKADVAEQLKASSKELINKKSKSVFGGSNGFSDLSDALGYVSRAIESYKDLLKTIENLNERNKNNESDDKSYLKWYSDDFARLFKEAKGYLDAAEKLSK